LFAFFEVSAFFVVVTALAQQSFLSASFTLQQAAFSLQHPED
jgi:hypothetical protein